MVHAVEAALPTGCPVAVVLGSRASEHAALLAAHEVEIAVDSSWQKGMGQSLKFGLRSVLRSRPALDSLIITVCDQPLLTTSIFKLLLAATTPLAACQYRAGWGVPALFTKPYFSELMALEAEEGAKKILQREVDAVTRVPFPEGDLDIDTPEDLAMLNSVVRH